MIKLKYAIALGLAVEQIRNILTRIDEINIGLFATSLRYRTKKEGKEAKKVFFERLIPDLEKINGKVRSFNTLKRLLTGKYLTSNKLPEIQIKDVKKIVLAHEGLVVGEDIKGAQAYADEVLATSKSASSYSRQNTIMKLRTVILPLRQATGRFFEDLEKLEEPYILFDKKRPIFSDEMFKEIDKSRAAYSIGLRGEAIFIIGRMYENLCRALLKTYKLKGNTKIKDIDLRTLDFNGILNVLKTRIKFFGPGQHAKALALKWDRNSLGHDIKKIAQLEKDADAVIKSGSRLVIDVQQKITKLRDK